MLNKESKCPCHSNKKYAECCHPYHNGKECENALNLMRSRYSAYALMLPDYIISTTHPKAPAYISDQHQWKEIIKSIYEGAEFIDLKIDSYIEENDRAIVGFIATITKNGNDISFSEISLFKKENNKWYYVQGKILPKDVEDLKSLSKFDIF